VDRWIVLVLADRHVCLRSRSCALKPEDHALSPHAVSPEAQTLPAMDSSSIFDCDMDALNQDIPNLDEEHTMDEDEDEGSVNVEKVLLKSLSVEVKEVLATIKSKDEWKKLRGQSDTMVCPLCPCRQFRDLKKQGKGRLLDHILLHHSGNEVAIATGKDFVASGSKQYMLIRALFDQQSQAQTEPSGLLRQSASLMRSWLSQCALPVPSSPFRQARPRDLCQENLLDRELVLCLTGEGPKYLGADMVKDSGLYRTVGYVWYDRDFARIFFGEMIRANGKAKAIATNLIHHFLSTGCQVVFLLPRKATTVYLKLMEDVMASPVVTAWKEKLVIGWGGEVGWWDEVGGGGREGGREVDRGVGTRGERARAWIFPIKRPSRSDRCGVARAAVGGEEVGRGVGEVGG